MVKRIILAILLLPAAEIAAFVLVATLIGLAGALLLMLATTFAGILVLRAIRYLPLFAIAVVFTGIFIVIESRVAEPVMPQPPGPVRPDSAASLWAGQQMSLVGDRRATARGDILTVVIEIDDRAEMSNSSGRSRSAGEKVSIPSLVGLPQRIDEILPEGASMDELASAKGASTFKGSGNISRRDKMTLRVAATVIETLPNGVSHQIIEREGDTGTFDNTPVFAVPAGHFFMMGDNRDNSDDGRYWGMLPEANLRGKAFLVWMNFKDFSRIGERIP